MNYIVGMMMVTLGPKAKAGDVFWLTLTVLHHVVPHYHDRNLIGAQIDSRILNDLLAECCPHCNREFEKQSVQPDLFFVEWLLAILSTALDVKLTQRVWDVLLHSGRPAFLRVCLAMMSWCHNKLVEVSIARGKEGAYTMMEIKDVTKLCTDDDMAVILHRSVGLKEIATDERIAVLHRKHKTAIIEETAEREVRREVRKLRETTTLTFDQAKAIRQEFRRSMRRKRGTRGMAPGEEDLQELVKEEIRCEEFRVLLVRLFPSHRQLMEDAAELFFAAFDADGSGTISMEELLRGCALCCSNSLEGFVTNIFNVFDADRSGGLDQEEVTAMVRWLYFVHYAKPPSDDEVKEWVANLFRTVDVDHSGTLEIEELLNGYKTAPLITECFGSVPSMKIPLSYVSPAEQARQQELEMMRDIERINAMLQTKRVAVKMIRSAMVSVLLGSCPRLFSAWRANMLGGSDAREVGM